MVTNNKLQAAISSQILDNTPTEGEAVCLSYDWVHGTTGTTWSQGAVLASVTCLPVLEVNM